MQESGLLLVVSLGFRVLSILNFFDVIKHVNEDILEYHLEIGELLLSFVL